MLVCVYVSICFCQNTLFNLSQIWLFDSGSNAVLYYCKTERTMALDQKYKNGYQNCSDLLWDKIVPVIEKNFWNSRLKAEHLQNFWTRQPFFEFSRGILLPKLFWPTVRKNCSSDREKLLKLEAEGREFAKFLDH